MEGTTEGFLDCTGREWKRSPPKPPYEIPMVERPYTNLMYLPYHVVPWWPVHLENAIEDLYYCVCVKCNECTVNVSALCLDFTAESWSVRIICNICSPELLVGTSYCGLVLLVKDKLSDILRRACQIQDSRCLMCEKEECEDKECDKVHELIGRTETQDLMELMYRNKVDILSCLRFKICHRVGCSVEKAKMVSCSRCRRVCYCTERCKKEDKENHSKYCVPFYEVWRN